MNMNNTRNDENTKTRNHCSASLILGLTAGLAAGALLAGCGPAHTGVYKEKKREYKADAPGDPKSAASYACATP